MNRKYFYPLLIGLLLISNLATLFFVMQKGKHKQFVEGPKGIIIERLDLDKQQIAAYEKLIGQHKKDIRASDQKIIQLKKELYNLLLNESNEQKSDSLTAEIGRIQKQIETIHFKHFKDIKVICKPDQMEQFNSLVGKLGILFDKNIHPRKRN